MDFSTFATAVAGAAIFLLLFAAWLRARNKNWQFRVDAKAAFTIVDYLQIGNWEGAYLTHRTLETPSIQGRAAQWVLFAAPDEQSFNQFLDYCQKHKCEPQYVESIRKVVLARLVSEQREKQL